MNVFLFEFFKEEDNPADVIVPETIVANVELPFQSAIIDSSKRFYYGFPLLFILIWGLSSNLFILLICF